MPAFDSSAFDPLAFDTDAATPAPGGPVPLQLDSRLGSHVTTIDLVERALSRLPHQYRGTNG